MNFQALEEVFQACWDQSEKSGWHDKFAVISEAISFTAGRHVELNEKLYAERERLRRYVISEKLATIPISAATTYPVFRGNRAERRRRKFKR